MFIKSLSDDYSWVQCEMKICVDVESNPLLEDLKEGPPP